MKEDEEIITEELQVKDRLFRIPTPEFVRIWITQGIENVLTTTPFSFNIKGNKGLICPECLFQIPTECVYDSPVIRHTHVGDKGTRTPYNCARNFEAIRLLTEEGLFDDYEVKR
ncbi:hypothetical protein HN592_03655 [Candidatus Woesearchaeota archaeon]|jgi:hypothetical protein|nr:hypothetical protein [Candidatus Woesearchaeota archaeon]MBT4368308.1 hypothetical protein [Candidatus Woesearchaeota archaeon]MBT4712797.1 hypothetical protein [Candidatus Woesearchaeota archaeon]MBT6639709.1 hypothetical protein [Candidatus Woesearchaeota archaeon]MBT7133881.1 hypothetical protein [Candidatus Woesearchaeota archaeon]